MKCVVISDTHGIHDKIQLPDGDVLIHCGDSTNHGSLTELVSFLNWFKKRPHKHKIMISGNHDFIIEDKPETLKELIPTNIEYLEDSWVEIEGKIFYGSPWVPQFFNWAFMEDRGDNIAKHWDKMIDKIDVLITHGPPYGHNDLAPPVFNNRPAWSHVGCFELLKKVYEVQPKVHVFGHIHEGYGMSSSDEVPTLFINAACMINNHAERFKRGYNKPQVFEI